MILGNYIAALSKFFLSSTSKKMVNFFSSQIIKLYFILLYGIYSFNGYLLVAYTFPGTVFAAGAQWTVPSRWLHSNEGRQKLSTHFKTK